MLLLKREWFMDLFRHEFTYFISYSYDFNMNRCLSSTVYSLYTTLGVYSHFESYFILFH